MLEYTVIKICDHHFQYINNLKLNDSSLAAKLLIFLPRYQCFRDSHQELEIVFVH